jgi:hypothetical protein
MKKELRKNTFPVSRCTNLSKMFFTILLRTRFGKDDIPVKSFLYDFFKNEIDKETEKKDNDKLKMIRNSDFYKFYNHSRDLEIWRYVYRLEKQHRLIATLPKRTPKGRMKRDKVRRDVKVNVILDEAYDYFLLAVLSKMRVSRRDTASKLEDVICSFNSLRELRVPLNKIFKEDEIRSFIIGKKGGTVKNPFLLSVDRFYRLSYFLYKELNYNGLDQSKKIKDMLEIKKRIDPYLKAVLMFSSFFGKEHIQYNAPYDFEEASKIEIEKEFNRICGSDVDNERKEITKIHCEKYWKDIAKPLIEMKREFCKFIEEWEEKDIVKAVNILKNNDFDSTFLADEDDVKENREILEKIKREHRILK